MQAALSDQACARLPDGHGRIVADLALAGGERIRSFTIVTTTPIELCAELYHRMPVVLKPASLAELVFRA